MQTIKAKEAAQAAININRVDWLTGLQAEFPHLEIHFIPGNHDCLPEFVSRLDSIGSIEVHSHHLGL